MEMTPERRARRHRALDEALTGRVEAFLRERERRGRAFTAAQFAEAMGIERFGERDAQLLLVALKGQGRVHYRQAGWYLGPSTDP
jgi:hypothetical protein